LRQVLGLGLVLGVGFSVAMSLLLAIVPSQAMTPFSTDPRVLADGAGFVRILAVG
jgi:Na+-driven multidrug efflux pump